MTEPDHLERLDPSQRRDHQAAQHWARYDWACQFQPARRVLDCSCGVGYGSSLLRKRGAERVVAIDIAAEAIEEARRRYGDEGIEYRQADALTLTAEQLGRFDRIVSLETIEHVGEPKKLLDVFASLLEPDGVLVISCPNDQQLGVENPYHLWRTDFDTLKSWLQERFAHVSCYAEVHTVGSSVWPADELENRGDISRAYTIQTRLVDSLPIGKAAGFLFACGRQAPKRVAPVAADLLDGMGYIRELERVKDELWNEMRQHTEQSRSSWDAQRARILELEQEKERLWAETQRLGQVWKTQDGRIAELEQEKDRIYQEGQQRVRELEEVKDRLWNELQELSKRVKR